MGAFLPGLSVQAQCNLVGGLNMFDDDCIMCRINLHQNCA